MSKHSLNDQIQPVVCFGDIFESFYLIVKFP